MNGDEDVFHSLKYLSKASITTFVVDTIDATTFLRINISLNDYSNYWYVDSLFQHLVQAKENSIEFEQLFVESIQLSDQLEFEQKKIKIKEGFRSISVEIFPNSESGEIIVEWEIQKKPDTLPILEDTIRISNNISLSGFFGRDNKVLALGFYHQKKLGVGWSITYEQQNKLSRTFDKRQLLDYQSDLVLLETSLDYIPFHSVKNGLFSKLDAGFGLFLSIPVWGRISRNVNYPRLARMEEIRPFFLMGLRSFLAYTSPNTRLGINLSGFLGAKTTISGLNLSDKFFIPRLGLNYSL